jgi:4-amino-4-deoxy-L-arabinose transferase-like glycosyltransferase
VLVQSTYEIFDAPFVAADSVLYLELGRSISDGSGMRTDEGPTAFVGPAYPLFLAALLRVGSDTLQIGLVQAVIGAATAAVVALVARELAGASRYGTTTRTAAMWASGVAAAVYPHVVLWTGYVLTETLFLFLAAAAVYAALRASRAGSSRAALLAGTLGAGAALTRPAFLAPALLVAVWLAWSARERRWVLAGLFAVGLAVPLSLWAARNAVEMGRPIVTATQAGGAMYLGNARGGTGGSRGYADSLDAPPLDLPAGLNEVERDDAHMRRALDDIAADPLGTIGRWPAKLWNMWRPTYEGASFRNGAASLASYLPLLVLGLAGAVVLASRSRIVSLPAILVATWAIAHMVIVGLIRYRVPGELFLLMAFPFGVERAWRWMRSR